MPQGWIVKALSGYYYVLPEQADIREGTIQCRARGVFKKKGISPLVGDHVHYELTENGEGTVTEILPRSSELIRPPIANVGQAVLVFSVTEPALNLQLLDKFLVHIEKSGLNAVICFTKYDLIAEEYHTDVDPAKKAISVEGIKLRDVFELYESIGYPVIVTSAKQKQGLQPILDRLSGEISVFAGQSGVGKSSLLNAIISGITLETNEISQKLGRGKHTTRHVELHPLDKGGFVADTPGFSQLDFMELEEQELGSCFKEFSAYAENCKFRGCLHLHEPGCKVIQAKEQGLLSASRYDHYVQFLTEMKDKKRRY
jgi:ribosome biogenesis GTPase / thiamine phosphate phosphatase